MESHPSPMTILYKGSVTISLRYIKKREINGPSRVVVMERSLAGGSREKGGGGCTTEFLPFEMMTQNRSIRVHHRALDSGCHAASAARSQLEAAPQTSPHRPRDQKPGAGQRMHVFHRFEVEPRRCTPIPKSSK